MEYVSKRDLNNKKRQEKYMSMYRDVSSGMSWEDLKKKYGYKNVASMRSAYYSYAIPFLKRMVEVEEVN